MEQRRSSNSRNMYVVLSSWTRETRDIFTARDLVQEIRTFYWRLARQETFFQKQVWMRPCLLLHVACGPR